MTETPTPVAALRARGALITLADGSEARLRYSMDSLEQLEREFGNIGNVLNAMKEAERSMAASLAVADGKATDEQRALYEHDEERRRAGGEAISLFGTIRRVILPGLDDAVATHPRTNQPFYLGDDPRAAAKLLDAQQMSAYVEAFSSAFGEAFYGGDTPAQGGGVQDPPLPIPTVADLSVALSHGPTGTTSVPSWAAGPTPSSGA